MRRRVIIAALLVGASLLAAIAFAGDPCEPEGDYLAPVVVASTCVGGAVLIHLLTRGRAARMWVALTIGAISAVGVGAVLSVLAVMQWAAVCTR